jgi:hypothetical protein
MEVKHKLMELEYFSLFAEQCGEHEELIDYVEDIIIISTHPKVLSDTQYPLFTLGFRNIVKKKMTTLEKIWNRKRTKYTEIAKIIENNTELEEQGMIPNNIDSLKKELNLIEEYENKVTQETMETIAKAIKLVDSIFEKRPPRKVIETTDRIHYIMFLIDLHKMHLDIEREKVKFIWEISEKGISLEKIRKEYLEAKKNQKTEETEEIQQKLGIEEIVSRYNEELLSVIDHQIALYEGLLRIRIQKIRPLIDEALKLIEKGLRSSLCYLVLKHHDRLVLSFYCEYTVYMVEQSESSEVKLICNKLKLIRTKIENENKKEERDEEIISNLEAEKKNFIDKLNQIFGIQIEENDTIKFVRFIKEKAILISRGKWEPAQEYIDNYDDDDMIEEIAAYLISILKENGNTWEKENKESYLKDEQKKLIKLQREDKIRIKEEQEKEKKQKEIEASENNKILGKVELKFSKLKNKLKKNK